NIIANKVLLKYWDKKKKNNGIYIELSNAENLLLKYLEQNKSISLSQFIRMAQITYNRAEHILAEFMLMDIIKMEIINDETNYLLIKPKTNPTYE
ncbi:hypothetical protein ACFLRG_02435, partial [Bacteroidota bacterium]